MAKCAFRFNLPDKKQDCIKHECEFYSHLIGMNPQTGQPTDQFGCAVSFIPILLIENANMIRQSAASTDKVANQINSQRAEFLGTLSDEARNRLLQSAPKLLTSNNGKK